MVADVIVAVGDKNGLIEGAHCGSLFGDPSC
jgi:hypothetical protein